jgi:hypothetical protein
VFITSLWTKSPRYCKNVANNPSKGAVTATNSVPCSTDVWHVVQLVTISFSVAVSTSQGYMVGWYINVELERTRKEAVLAYGQQHGGIWWQRPRKEHGTRNTLARISRVPIKIRTGGLPSTCEEKVGEVNAVCQVHTAPSCRSVRIVWTCNTNSSHSSITS